MLDDAELIKVVKQGGAPASAAIATLLSAGKTYPGEISDIEAMTNDFSSAAFSYPIASVAWAYLEAHGIKKYKGDNEQIKKIIKASADGSLYE